jgi:hypothetical protein
VAGGSSGTSAQTPTVRPFLFSQLPAFAVPLRVALLGHVPVTTPVAEVWLSLARDLRHEDAGLPARGCDLSKHFVLWEVESWDFAPPIGPMLLRPIGGNLYAVIAQWDLTDIERMIIAGTRRQ